MTLANLLAARLKQARKAAGLSRVDAAQASGVSTSTIERIEQAVGPGTIQTLSLLCRAYGVSMDWAAGNIDRPNHLLPGWFLVDVELIEAVLATTNADEILELCNQRRGSIVDFATAIPEDAEVLSPAETLTMEREFVSHVAAHATGDLKTIFEQHLRETGG